MSGDDAEEKRDECAVCTFFPGERKCTQDRAYLLMHMSYLLVIDGRHHGHHLAGDGHGACAYRVLCGELIDCCVELRECL